MRRCYRGAALMLGTILTTGLASVDSCGMGALVAYAAEDGLPEEMEHAFQTEVQTGEENVETDIPEEEIAGQSEAEASQETTGTENTDAEEPVPQETPYEEAAAEVFSMEDQEYQILLKIVEAEAGGEDTIGKMLVAGVVMNRVGNGAFPDSVSEVVYETSNGTAQFSPTADGRINAVVVSEDTVDAVNRVLGGENVSQGALYFRSVNSSNGWFDQSLNRVLEHGNHIFYTL